jgi:CO/xanthine dehydrogenase FAD-binding subunit
VTVTSYFLPGSLPEALGLLEAHGSSLLVMAGGTVAMPLVNEGISLPGKVMGLRNAGLDGIEHVGDELRIGATATITQLLAQEAVPMLRQAAARTASWSIRNMATVGGNLFTPPPGGDIAVALLALDARVTLSGPKAERNVALRDFYTGFMTTAMRSDELLTSITVPVEPGETTFIKLGRKQANTPAIVTVAVHLVMDGDTVTRARIALGAVDEHPIRAAGAEAAITGSALEPVAITEAAAAAAAECHPFTDAIASDWYRRRMVGVLVGRALTELAAPAGGRGA